MPRKYQSGKLEVRRDVARPYYFVRATVPRIDSATGKPKKVRPEHRLGFLDEMSAAEAEAARVRFLESVNAGRFITQSNVRFRDLAARYTTLRLPLMGVATRAQYTLQIENHLVPYFGEKKLAEIDKQAIEMFLAAKIEKLGWWARRSKRTVFSGMFAAAKDWKLYEGDNPATGIRLGRKTAVREKRLLTVEQLRLLLAALSDRPKFIVLIIFGCGLSISETLGLKWSDIDFENAVLSIRRRWYRGDIGGEGATKTDARCSTMRLAPSMLAEFQQRYPGPHKRDTFVFVGDDGKMPPDDRDLLRFEFRPVVVRLGLYYNGFGWHAFRRQNITWRQTVGGASPLEAQKAARHASLDMTLLYTLTDVERETMQQQKMFDYLLGLPEGGLKA